MDLVLNRNVSHAVVSDPSPLSFRIVHSDPRVYSHWSRTSEGFTYKTKPFVKVKKSNSAQQCNLNGDTATQLTLPLTLTFQQLTLHLVL